MSLGIGVMIGQLSGNEETVNAYNNSKGKTIKDIKIEGNELILYFKDGAGLKFVDDGQSCCESRYMNCDEDLNEHIGNSFMDAELQDGGSTEDDYGKHEIMFLKVLTDKGWFKISNHNEHNGYYGGFDIILRELSNDN